MRHDALTNGSQHVRDVAFGDLFNSLTSRSRNMERLILGIQSMRESKKKTDHLKRAKKIAQDVSDAVMVAQQSLTSPTNERLLKEIVYDMRQLTAECEAKASEMLSTELEGSDAIGNGDQSAVAGDRALELHMLNRGKES